MAKAPSEARMPSNGRIPVPKAAKGAVRRTIQGNLNNVTKLLPTKIRLPIPPASKKLRENCNDHENKICSDSKKIPIISKTLNSDTNVTISLSDKIDLEKTIDILPDIGNKTLTKTDKKPIDANQKEMDANKREYISRKNNSFSESIGKKVTAIVPEDSGAFHSVSGVLRYFGRVQIDDDIWCGIETDKPSPEYHDGSVNGVKYFSCANGHGMLIPASYVLPDYQCQLPSVNPKILEFRKKLQHINSRPSKSVDECMRLNVVDITQRLIEDEERQSESGPYSLLVGLDSTITKSDNQLNNLKDSNDDTLSKTVDISSKFPIVYGAVRNNKVGDETFSNSNLSSYIKKDLYESDVKMIEDESVVDFQCISLDSVVDLSLKDARRKSSIISQSHNYTNKISTPDYRGIFSVDNTSTPLEELNKPLEIIKNYGMIKKNIRIENQYDNRQFILQQPSRKQNTKPPTIHDSAVEISSVRNFPMSEYKLMKSSPIGTIGLSSPTVSENSNQELSKQNSFEESLGLLTPEQMESLSFLENIFSPSSDDIVGMLESDKVTEKTESSSTQTPTENVQSVIPDTTQLITNSTNISQKTETANDFENCSNNSIVVCIEHGFPDLDNDTLIDNVDSQHDTYEAFIQRPFRQSTAENLANNLDLCSGASQTIDDELLPSVHSSILDALSSIVDTTRFDNIQHSVRMDQTPSPEELPLDPVDIKSDCMTLSVDPKTDTSKSVTYSITSITSLDGYQGDGEMSRPVSRGADQSPTIGHRVNNIQNWRNIPINRRPDPMTDSDFFTESDADGHDEQVHRGDRRAQVIDGALYGGGKASNPPVLVSRNNNSNDDSCMESSGVFTDMETHRSSPLLLNVIDDLSPEGSSSSTRSDASQNNNSEMFHAGFNETLNNTVIDASTMQNVMSSGDNKENKDKNVDVSPSNSPNEKTKKDDKNTALKKYKMPRRDVASKVKSMMTSSSKSLADQEKQTLPKKEGRWDAVMNKISVSKSESNQKLFSKEIKSNCKVNSAQSSEKTSFCEDNSVTSAGKPKTKASLTKLKARRVKSNRMPKISMLDSSSRSTPHSSQSDLSVSCSAPTKIATAKHTVTRAAKKRDANVAGPGRPLSPQGAPPPAQSPAGPHPAPRNRTPPAANGRPVNTLVKKPVGVSSLAASPPTTVVNNGSSPKGLITQRKPIPRRAATQLSPRTPSLKDQNRASSTANVLKVSQGAGAAPALPVLPVVQQAPPNRGVEALAVLVQYLVFHLDALNAPRWRAQAAGAKAQLAEAAGRLQRAIASQIADQHTLTQSLTKITLLEDELKTKENEHNNKVLATANEAESKYRAALEESSALCAEIKSLKSTLNQLKQEVADSRTRVVRAEDATRKHEAEKAALLNELKLANEESEKLRALNVEMEKSLALKKQELDEYKLVQQEIKEISVNSAAEEITSILNSSKDSNQSTPRMKQNKMAAEIESLKTVLDMKMKEISDIRKKHEEAENIAEQLPALLKRNTTLSSTVDLLKTQINRKSEDEIALNQRIKQMEESLSRESGLNDGLKRYNEELLYKLKQMNEVVHYFRSQNNGSSQRRMGLSMSDSVQNQTYPRDAFIRGQERTTASFNEKYLHSTSFQDRRSDWRSNSRRSTLSESCDNKSDDSRYCDFFDNYNSSPPNSPKVKGIVEKNDSVSYVLEIETSEEMVSRLTRCSGSFRATTSPPSRDSTKRLRIRSKASGPPMVAHSLSQSASASCIEPSALRSSSHKKLYRSNSIERNQYIPSKPIRTSTPSKTPKRSNLCSVNTQNGCHAYEKIHINGIDLPSSFSEKNTEDINNPIQSPTFEANGELSLLSECESVPKESAGEALISGANSEDDSSLDEPSNSSSDSESGSECDKFNINVNGAEERSADPALQKIAETLDQSLSATPMDVSWSEDGVLCVTESDI